MCRRRETDKAKDGVERMNGSNFTKEKSQIKSLQSMLNERKRQRKRGEKVKRLRQIKKESCHSPRSPSIDTVRITDSAIDDKRAGITGCMNA